MSHDASRQISVFSPWWKELSRVLREIFNDLNFKMHSSKVLVSISPVNLWYLINNVKCFHSHFMHYCSCL